MTLEVLVQIAKDDRRRVMPMPEDRNPRRGRQLAYPQDVHLVNSTNPDLKREKTSFMLLYLLSYVSAQHSHLSSYPTMKDDEGRWLNKDGYPKEEFPNQWKGKNGLYFVGFAKRGLAAIASDSENTANDIARALGQA